MNNVIVSRQYGSFEALAATVENAQAIFNNHKDNIDDMVRTLIERKSDFFFISISLLGKALAEIVEKDAGATLQYLPMIFQKNEEVKKNQDTWINDVRAYMIKNELTLKNLKSSSYFSHNIMGYLPEEQLSFLKKLFKNKKPICYVDYDEYFDIANKVATIERNVWKEGVSDVKIINYILNFINSHLVDTSDVVYEQLEVKEKY